MKVEYHHCKRLPEEIYIYPCQCYRVGVRWFFGNKEIDRLCDELDENHYYSHPGDPMIKFCPFCGLLLPLPPKTNAVDRKTCSICENYVGLADTLGSCDLRLPEHVYYGADKTCPLWVWKLDGLYPETED